MTECDLLALNGEQLANIWRVKHPQEIATECGASKRVMQVLGVRVARLRKQGWQIRKWPSGCQFPPKKGVPK